MTASPSPLPARVFTTFGTVIYLDPASGQLRHGDVDASPANLSLVADQSGPGSTRRARFVTTEGGPETPIVCTAAACRPATGSGAADLELVALERGLFGLRHDGAFLCAEAGGHVSLSRSKCSVWEAFLASEPWCASPFDEALELDLLGDEQIDWRGLARFQVNPFLRAKTGWSSGNRRILIYANTEWSNGRVYYDVSRALYRSGYVADILNWRLSYVRNNVTNLLNYYDYILTGLDGIHALIDFYDIPYDRIIGLSHGIGYDVPVLVSRKGISTLSELANFGVVSYSMVSDAISVGSSRVPMVASLGVFCDLFRADVAERLDVVGYATSMSVAYNGGVEVKRGRLAQAAAEAAGLPFMPAGTHDKATSFHDMPAYYSQVGAIIMSSLVEPAGLPVLEAAAAGRLVIGTPTGHFPLRAYQGAGILAPMHESGFVKFTADTLRYYSDNPSAYVDKCHEIQGAARRFDWKYTIQEWIELIESAGA